MELEVTKTSQVNLYHGNKDKKINVQILFLKQKQKGITSKIKKT